VFARSVNMAQAKYDKANITKTFNYFCIRVDFARLDSHTFGKLWFRMLLYTEP